MPGHAEDSVSILYSGFIWPKPCCKVPDKSPYTVVHGRRVKVCAIPPIICSMCCLYQLEFFIDAVAVSLPEADRSIMRHSTHHEKGGFLAEKRPLSYFILSEIENFQSSLYYIGFHFEERVAVIK